MHVTFEHAYQVHSGIDPIALHYKDNYVKTGYLDPSSELVSRQAGTAFGNWTGLIFADESNGVDENMDASASLLRLYSYSGVEHWICYNRNGEQMVSKYRWKMMFILTAEQIIEEELNRLAWQLEWQIIE